MKCSFLTLTLVVILPGCTSKPQADQVPATQWVQEQIAQGAISISQAQTRLHQVNGEHSLVLPQASVSTPAIAPASAAVVPVKPVGGPPCVCSGSP